MKHIKCLNKIIRFCLCLSLLCSSCAGDYLDTNPTNEVSPADLFKNEDYAAYAVNGLARLMKVNYYIHALNKVPLNGEGSVKLVYADFQGADMYCPIYSYYKIFNGVALPLPDSGFGAYLWHYYYKIISNANAIISYVDPEASSRFKYIYAQALTYRAYCYLHLLQFYSPRWCDSQNGSADGVVLRLDVSSTGDCPFSSMLTCYEQIYKDLDNAISYYQASGITRAKDENHKVNVDAAYALYARTALTREDWGTAARYAALARANYPLMNTSEYYSGFNTPNQEWIWSIYDSKEETLGMAALAAYLAYNSIAYASAHPTCINKELYDKIPASDIRRDLFLDPSSYSEDDYDRTGGSNNGWAWSGTELDIETKAKYPDLSASAKVFAYMSFKFKCISQPTVMPFNLFRSSEMYLIEAEANCHLTPSKEAEARQLLKELVHDSGRDPEYTCTKSGQELLDEIKFYRRIELWGEGFSWFDYKRRKDTIVRNTFQNGGNYMNNAAITIRPEDINNWMWTIPAKEYEYNNAIKRQ